jgi:hypothetical protein
MKKTLLILAALASTYATSNAATLVADNYSNGLTLSDGVTAMSTGTLRFGYFTISDAAVLANAGNVSFLDANFVSVLDYSGAINSIGTDGFFANDTLGSSAIYAGGSTVYDGVVYDGSAGATTNVVGDIAGNSIYLWALNGSLLSATQQGIFATTYTWTDSDTAGSNDSSFDMVGANLTAIVGGEANGADIGGGAPSHTLADIGAVPEPSRALLLVGGLAGMMLRRRRRA